MGVGLGFWFFWAEFWGLCHFERSEKSTEFKIRFLNLWILRCAQYDKQKIFVVRLGFCGGLGEFLFFCVCVGFWRICHFEPFAKRRKIHIVILSVSEISTEFKIRFKF